MKRILKNQMVKISENVCLTVTVIQTNISPQHLRYGAIGYVEIALHDNCCEKNTPITRRIPCCKNYAKRIPADIIADVMQRDIGKKLIKYISRMEKRMSTREHTYIGVVQNKIDRRAK